MTDFTSEIVVVINALQQDAAPTVSSLLFATYGGWYGGNLFGGPFYFDPRIKSDFVLTKEIGVKFWNQRSGIDFGFIDIAVEDQDANIIDFVSKVTLAGVGIYRVGQNGDLTLVAQPVSEDIGFQDENTIRFRLESIVDRAFDLPINEHYYDDTHPDLEGKPFPIAWGQCTAAGLGAGINAGDRMQLPTVFVDPTTLRYDVTDLDIIDQSSGNQTARDRGVAVAHTIVDNGFTLSNNPDGKITWQNNNASWLDDPLDTGNEFSGVFRLVRLALTRVGVFNNVNTTELMAWDGLFAASVFPVFTTLDVTPARVFMDQIADSFGGWYFADENNVIRFGQLIAPEGETPVIDFVDDDLVGEIQVNDDKAPGLSTRSEYGPNPGSLEPSDVAGSVSNALRAALLTKSYTKETTETVISFYEGARSVDPILWSGRMQTAAGVPGTLPLAELNRWWADLYPVRRRFYTFTYSLRDIDPLPQLGDVVSLQSDRLDLLETPKNLVVRKIRMNLSQGLVTAEGWG